MKLIIQIPCFNEEQVLPQTMACLPKNLSGVDIIETLVIDDGSSDNTVAVALEAGVDHVISLNENQGLAVAFSKGLEACLQLGADVIVNTDADNQYDARYIQELINPILEGRHQIVVGCRPIEDIQDFSYLKKRLQRLGSYVVRFVSRANIPDATSGFRAYSRLGARGLCIISPFTYTLESLIQAKQKGISIGWVDVKTNPKTRESRLFKSMFQYIFKSVGTIVRISTQFQPLKTFMPVGIGFILAGLVPAVRFLYYYFAEYSSGHVQSLILSSILLSFGFISILIGLLADQVAANRIYLDTILLRMKEMDEANKENIPHYIAGTKTKNNG